MNPSRIHYTPFYRHSCPRKSIENYLHYFDNPSLATRFTLSTFPTYFLRRTQVKTDEPVKDRNLLLTAVLADAINLGLTKMAESAPGITYARLARLAASLAYPR